MRVADGEVRRGKSVLAWFSSVRRGMLCSGGQAVVWSGRLCWARLGKSGRSWFGNTGHGTVGLGKAVKLRSGWVGCGRVRSGGAVN